MSLSSRPVAVAFVLLASASSSLAAPITAVLRLRARVSIEALAGSVSDPKSAHYGRFYTPEEIGAVSGPSDLDYRALLAQVRADGFKIESESPTHLWVGISGDAPHFEKTFGAKFEFLADGRHRDVASARVPFRYSMIQSVAGLDSVRKARPHLRRGEDGVASATGISQGAIKTAYGFDAIYRAGITGKGQHVAVATYDGFNVDDVREFYRVSNLSPGPTVDLVSFNGTAAFDSDSAIETELDAEFSGMIAPGAAVHVFASASNSDAGELQMFTAILDDNRAKVANYSWGSCETELTPAHRDEMAKVFARAQAQGVNVMVASGDTGSDSCGNGTLVADWPAAAIGVVAVGGTTLSLQNSILSESAWKGSGGGISAVFGLPTWQSGLGGPFVRRSYPDVAFNADPSSGQAVWAHVNGVARWLVIGGTSMSAPQWSGFMALVGEAREAAGLGPLGDLNPVLYGLKPSERETMLNDVTVGSNGAYQAGPGWDAVTGFGSLQAAGLLERLAR